MNDTKGCFDQIQHTFTVLVLMHYGVAWSVATTQIGVLQKAKYKIKTGYGVSTPVYGDEETAISGIGQDKGLSPVLWALISPIIFKMCKAKGHGINATTAISKQEISFMGFAFVDDIDLVADAEDVNTPGATMIARFQAITTCWNGGIRISGGLIVPEKTQWFWISFYWDGWDLVYHTKDILSGNNTLPDKNGDIYTVTREKPTSAFVSLGFNNPLSGGDAATGEVIWDAANVFEAQMLTSHCDKTSCLLYTSPSPRDSR